MELDDLPDEILVEIFLFLAPNNRSIEEPRSATIGWPQQALKLSLCCSRWYHLVMVESHDDLLWRDWHDLAQRTWVQENGTRWEMQDYRERCIIRPKGRHRRGIVSRSAISLPQDMAHKVRDREDMVNRQKIEILWQLRDHIYWRLYEWERRRARNARIGWSCCVSLDLCMALLAIWIVLNLAAFLISFTLRDLLVHGIKAISSEGYLLFTHITFAPLWVNIVLVPPVIARIVVWGIRTRFYHLVLYLPMAVYGASFIGVWLGVVYINDLLPPFAQGPWALIFLPIYVACLSAVVVIPIACYYHAHYMGDNVSSRIILRVLGGGVVALWNALLISMFVVLVVTQLHLPKSVHVAVTYLPLYILEGTNLVLVVIWCFSRMKSKSSFASIVLLGLAISSLPISHVVSSVAGTFAAGTGLLVIPLLLICLAMVRPIWYGWRFEQNCRF